MCTKDDTPRSSYQKNDETSRLVNPTTITTFNTSSSDNGGGGVETTTCFESDDKRNIGFRRFLDILIGFVIAVILFIFIHHQHSQNSSNSTKQNAAVVAAANCSSSDSAKIKLRGRQQSSIPPTVPTTAHFQDSKYDKFQALGFQIYTGGSPVLIPEETTSTMVYNPECKGRTEIGYSDNPDHANETILFQCYLGHNDPMVDVRNRLRVMYDAVEAAYNAADPNPTTLKIFNAPEFFFRGLQGAYIFDNKSNNSSPNIRDDNDDEEDCEMQCQILLGLESLVANKKYEHWLFLFGTIVVAEKMPQNETHDYLFYNFAPVYKGYDPKTSDHRGKRFLVPKRYISNMDFLTPNRQYMDNNMTKEIDALEQGKSIQQAFALSVEKSSNMNYGIVGTHPSSNNDDHHQQKIDDRDGIVDNPFWYYFYQGFYDKNMWNNYHHEIERLGYTVLEDDWLIIDNITMTIEICLDHDYPASRAMSTYTFDDVMGSPTRIPKSVETWDPIANKHVGSIEMVPIPRHMAQISMVSSMGMSLNYRSMALTNGGTIFLQDGENGSNGTMSWIRGSDGWYQNQFDGGSELVTRNANISTTRDKFQYEVHNATQFIGVYDDPADSTDEAWKKHVRGIFSTAHHEPLVRVYEVQDIATVVAEPN